MTIYNYIIQIENDRKEKQRAILRERLHHVPLLTDYAIIPDLYRCFLSFFPTPKNTEDEMLRRRVFMLIIIRLFNPRALAGYKLDGRTRKGLARTFGTTPSNISHLFRNLSFQFKNIGSFREVVEVSFQKLISEKNLSL